MNTLPTEMRLQILSWIKPWYLVSVCKEWYDYACELYPEILVRKYAAKCNTLSVTYAHDLEKKIKEVVSKVNARKYLVLDVQIMDEGINLKISTYGKIKSTDISLVSIPNTCNITIKDLPDGELTWCNKLYEIYEVYLLYWRNEWITSHELHSLRKITKLLWQLVKIKRKTLVAF